MKKRNDVRKSVRLIDLAGLAQVRGGMGGTKSCDLVKKTVADFS